MGVCQSTELIKAREVSNRIDKQLQLDPKVLIQKLLLLGPAESGKSTCVKQMQILHLNGFTNAEVEEKKCIIYSNTVRSMFDLLQAKSDLGLNFENTALLNDAIIVKKHIENGLEFAPFSTQVKEAIQKLWLDPTVKLVYERRADYHIHDSAAYYFENIERIGEKDYRPTNQDILHTRVPTTGVVKLLFTFNGIDFNVFDVGGQRSERRKWIHIFDDVNAIIFVVAISEYDQRIREDNATVRFFIRELFESITNSVFFSKSSMILFLNKIDIFADKIKKVSLTVIFPSYKGGLNYDQGIAYLRRRFLKLYRIKQKLYIHETCATNTNQLESVFTSVLDTIVQENLQDTGML